MIKKNNCYPTSGFVIYRLDWLFGVLYPWFFLWHSEFLLAVLQQRKSYANSLSISLGLGQKNAFYSNYWLGSNKPRIILFSCFAELYEFCLKEGYADKNLIAKWKKQGYENLCCLRCIQCRDTNFGTNCICRVPKSKLEEVIVTWIPLICSNTAECQKSLKCDWPRTTV